jgi:nicotinate phosphoribosyltransferase
MSEQGLQAPVGALLTDLYQLTMLAAYRAERMEDIAVFELFVRALPPSRRFLVAAGLEQALEFLETLAFEPSELDWIAASGFFPDGFAGWLAKLRFTGDVDAVPEGTIVFENEPLLRVVAPIHEAQLVETRLVNIVHYQTLIASKAARCVLAAGGKRLVDFGLRRAHGAEAGLFAARASFLAGFDGTATTLAASRYEIPVFGTMAHSYVQAHADEGDAFAAFAASFPRNAVLLLDTYDTVHAAHKVVELAGRLKMQGIVVKGVRLDSGDLDALAREVRAVLDAGGLTEALVFASGNLDEQRLAKLVAAGAPIDAYGIGTSLVTSSDTPSLDMVYKLQEYAGRPRRKRSQGKATWPGRKQVFRFRDNAGMPEYDEVVTYDESRPGEALLVPVMRGGRRLAPVEPLAHLRERTLAQLRSLPAALRSLDAGIPYPVRISPAIQVLARRCDERD